MLDDNENIAVIGMAGRFPGAGSVNELWNNLRAGKVSIHRFSTGELRDAGVTDDLSGRDRYVPVGADLTDADLFDADFFGVADHEAMLTDPQHRIFLECSWQALEDAGHDPASFDGKIGVFGATSMSSYLLHLLRSGVDMPPDGINYPLLLGNDKDFLCTRVSYKLGLRGPSANVQTACSASLVAVHLAVSALMAGECDLALAGGVSVLFPQRAGYLYREGGILSPDGQCRVFDAAAAGTVKGNGCGLVVLRRLGDARSGRDRIHAVIRGSAVNNDGSDKVGFTAPGSAGQVAVIREALAVAGVEAAEIGYVEAHGTGTSLGDPVELKALYTAHGADGPAPEDCHIGSVKANLGHLDAASGVTGLIKTVLVLRDQVVPVQAGFRTPNPRLAGYLSRYRLADHTGAPAKPIRAAGVSSFGIGGTNAHAVLAAAPPSDRPPPAGPYLVALSARDNEALRTMVAELGRYVAITPDVRLDDIAYTCVVGRRRYPVRAVLAASSIEDLVARCADFGAPGSDRVPTAHAAAATGWLDGGELTSDLVGDCAQARRTSLPGHPLRPRRFWFEPVAGAPARSEVAGTGFDAEQVVLTAAHDLLGTARLAVDDDVYDAGLDSMTLVELVTSLRDRTGRSLRFELFDGLRTVRQMARLLDDRRPSQSTVQRPAPPHDDLERYRHLLVKLRNGDEDSHIFLIHPAGGSTACYLDLASQVQDRRTMWALGYPGDEVERYETVRAMAALYVGLIRSVQPTGPYLLGGYSLGGNVALEMAVMMESRGEKVSRIIMIDSHPPEAYLGGVATEEDYFAAAPALFAQILPGGQLPEQRPRTLTEVLAAIRRPSWSPSMEAEMARFVGLWRVHHQALKRWYPDVAVTADVIVLAASAPEDQTVLDLLDIRRIPRSGWGVHVSGSLTVIPVPGDHYSMLRDPANVPGLAAAYDAALRQGHERPDNRRISSTREASS